jgi:ferredoxin
VKNLFGCVPGLEKAQYHLKVPEREDFASMLVDLMLACKPTLAIMDAVVGMEGEGPAGGDPRQIGALLASPDSVALDVVASAMAGFDPMEVYTNAVAAARGIGPSSADEVDVIGAEWRELAPEDFKLPARDITKMVPRWLRGHLTGWTTAKPILEYADKCTRCEFCAQVCPVDAIVVGSSGPTFDRQACIRCYCCQELCPPQAIGLSVPPLARMAIRRR